MAEGIREVAVQRKHDVLNERVDAKMETLGGLTPFCSPREGVIELAEIFYFDHHVELAQHRRAQAELVSRQFSINPSDRRCPIYLATPSQKAMSPAPGLRSHQT